MKFLKPILRLLWILTGMVLYTLTFIAILISVPLTLVRWVATGNSEFLGNYALIPMDAFERWAKENL